MKRKKYKVELFFRARILSDFVKRKNSILTLFLTESSKLSV